MNRTSAALLATALCIFGLMAYMIAFGFRSGNITLPPILPTSSQPRPTPEPTKPLFSLSTPTASDTKPAAEAELAAKVLSIAELTDPTERERQLQEFATALSSESMGKVLERLLEVQFPASITETRNALVRFWAKMHPASAATWAWRLPPSEPGKELLTQVAISWANDDLDSAVTWLEELPEADPRKNLLRTTVANEAARTNEITAVTLAARIPDTQGRDQVLEHTVRQWAVKAPQAAVSWANQIEEAPLKEKMLAAIAVEWSANDPIQAGNLAINSLQSGRLQEDTVVAIVQRWAKQDPQAASAWVETFPESALKQTAAQNIQAISAVSRQ